MVVNFYNEVKEAIKRGEKRPQTIQLFKAKEIFDGYTEEGQARLAYRFNRWEWDEELLGKYTDYKTAWEYSSIFTSFCSHYKRFKYECMLVKGMKKKEFLEEVLASIYNSLFR